MTDAIACSGNPVLYLSQLLDQPVLDAHGGRIGTVRDLDIQFGSSPYPPVCGIVASHAHQEVFLDSQQVAEVSREGAGWRPSGSISAPSSGGQVRLCSGTTSPTNN